MNDGDAFRGGHVFFLFDISRSMKCHWVRARPKVGGQKAEYEHAWVASDVYVCKCANKNLRTVSAGLQATTKTQTANKNSDSLWVTLPINIRDSKAFCRHTQLPTQVLNCESNSWRLRELTTKREREEETGREREVGCVFEEIKRGLRLVNHVN